MFKCKNNIIKSIFFMTIFFISKHALSSSYDWPLLISVPANTVQGAVYWRGPDITYTCSVNCFGNGGAGIQATNGYNYPSGQSGVQTLTPGLGLQFIGCINWLENGIPGSYCRNSFSDNNAPQYEGPVWFLFSIHTDVSLTSLQGHFELVGLGGSVTAKTVTFPPLSFFTCYGNCHQVLYLSDGATATIAGKNCAINASGNINFTTPLTPGTHYSLQSEPWSLNINCTGNSPAMDVFIAFDASSNTNASSRYILNTNNPGVVLMVSKSPMTSCSPDNGNNYLLDRTQYNVNNIPAGAGGNATSNFYWNACIPLGLKPNIGTWNSNVFYNIYYQ